MPQHRAVSLPYMFEIGQLRLCDAIVGLLSQSAFMKVHFLKIAATDTGVVYPSLRN